MKENIDRTIWKVLSEQATPEEKAALEQWIKESDHNQQVYQSIETNWSARSKEPRLVNEEEMFEKIWAHGMNKKSHKFLFNRDHLLKIAASLLIVMVATFLVVRLSKDQSIKPESTPPKLVVKENPAGQKSKVFLPDGSEVWLNAESTLGYYESFSDSNRLVHLTGEAFFEVSKDSLRPFIVYTNNIRTQALGTSFNINAFPENKSITVNLVTGKVKVVNDSSRNSFLLEPGEGLKFESTASAPQRYLFDVEKVLGWKDGILSFDQADFAEIKIKLERWYGIKINIDSAIPSDWQFSGSFNNEPLARVLEVMQYSREFTYKINDKQLLINF